MKRGEQAVLEVVHYFRLFDYAPSDAEIRTFLPIKVSKDHVAKLLKKMVSEKKLEEFSRNMPSGSIYTIPGYSIFFKKKAVRKGNTYRKLARLKIYLRILHMSPWIKFVGVSGSCSMDNAKANDDVDLFIVTSSGRLWLARIWSILVAEGLFLRRRRGDKHIAGKVCLNMFFEEKNMRVPKAKRNLYTAHEVVQMKPITMRRGALYHRLFLQSNSWIQDFFPNVSVRRSKKARGLKRSGLVDIMEYIAAKFQLWLIARHKTTEIVTSTQLWFFPDDFQAKVEEHLGR